MACFHPLTAYQLATGEITFAPKGTAGRSRKTSFRPPDLLRELSLPCGQCVGCRLERSRQWAVRCVHESQMHEFSSFVTLTYADEFCPISLNYRDYQLFMKRLRKQFKRVRFFMAGEYGDQFGRPHYHACLFGVFFLDRKLYRILPTGHRLYTSEILSRLWPYGFCSIGDVTFESAAYVARYVCKKVTGRAADDHYTVVCGETGEIVRREPEFAHMSLKPGIGATWYAKYRNQVYPRDEVVVRGSKMKPPKYYDRLLEKEDNFQIDEVAFSRYETAMMRSAENTEDRLRVSEVCTKARLGMLKRTIT